MSCLNLFLFYNLFNVLPCFQDEQFIRSSLPEYDEHVVLKVVDLLPDITVIVRNE